MKKTIINNIDKTFWLLFILLVVIAVIALFSASSTLVYKYNSAFGAIGQQIGYLALGLGAAFFLQFVPSEHIRKVSYFGLGISIVFVLLTMFPDLAMVEAYNGAARWVKIFGIRFQPSELAKLFLVIVVADLLSQIKTEKDKRKYFYWTLGLTALTAIPIMLGNLSTAILISFIILILWILARIPWKYICSVILIIIAFLALGYIYVDKHYVQPKIEMDGPFKRSTTWVQRVNRMVGKGDDKEENKTTNILSGERRQEAIAGIAIMRGGKTPVGVLPGNSKERNFLPLAFADYIFAIIVEETGIVGAAGLCFLYLAILFRACVVSSRYEDYAAMLMVMGLALMITCQALISMAVAVGIGPVTGQPLPLISRGGTSVLITSIYFGIILCVSREQNELVNRGKTARAESEEMVPELDLEK